MAKVSIIIPVYGVEKYISKALDSVINQTLKDIEIICIDDCSPDNCPAILDEYAAKDSRLKVVHLEKNGGPGNARNIGIDMATSEYIMFLDPDDWYELDACELAYNQISKNNDDFVYFGLYTFNEKNETRNLLDSRLKQFRQFYHTGSFSLSNVDNLSLQFGESGYKIYSRGFIINNDIKFSTHFLLEDVPFYIKAAVYAKSVSVLDKPLYYYLIRNNSAVSNGDKWLDIFEARDIAYKIVCESPNRDVYLYPYLAAYINSIWYYYNSWKKLDRIASKEYYNKMRELFVRLNESHDISKLKDNIPYGTFKRIVKYDYKSYKLNNYLKKNFIITNDKKSKYMLLFGHKFILKRL